MFWNCSGNSFDSKEFQTERLYIEDFIKNQKTSKNLLYIIYFFTTPLPYSKIILGNNFDFNPNDIKSFSGNSSYSTFTETKFLLQTKCSSNMGLVTDLITFSL
jgi:hypothetical protein